jgi:hypothetical protein
MRKKREDAMRLRWKPLIEQARSQQELRNVIGEYVTSFLPSELTALPESVLAILSDPAATIDSIALEITTAELVYAGDDDTRQLLFEIAQTFSAAAHRLSVLHLKDVIGSNS